MSEDKLSYLAKRWQYKTDSSNYGWRESWKILKKPDSNGKYVGDCEDFSLTLLWLLADENTFKFWWFLLSGKAKICFVGLESAWRPTHAMLRYEGKYTDNISKKWLTPKDVSNWKFHPLYAFTFQVAVRLLLSWIMRKIK